MAKAEVIITATDRTQAAIQSAQKGMQGLNNSALILRKTLGLISGAAVGAFFVRSAVQAADFADQINKAAISAGVTTNALSELAFAAKLSNIDLNSLTTSLRFMQKGLAEARIGTGEAKRALELLGISVKTISDLDPDKQFEFFADAIASIKDPADKAYVATKLFGDSGARLLPLFEQGAEGIRKAREEAIRFNQSISQEQAQKLTAARDSVTKLTSAFDGMAVSLTSLVAGPMTDFFDAITRIATNSYGQGVSGIAGVVELYRKEIELIRDEMNEMARDRDAPLADQSKRQQQLQDEIAAYEKAIKILSEMKDQSGDESFIASAIPKLENVVIQSTKTAVSGMQSLYEQWNNNTKTTIEKQVQEFAKFEAQVSELLSANEITLAQANARLGEELDSILTGVEVTGKRVTEATKSDIGMMSEFASQAARNMQSAFANFLFDPFQNGLKGMLKGFIDTIRRMVAEFAASQLMKFFFTPFASGSGLLASFAKFAIGGKAMGGSVLGSKPYIVGERGPELFVPGSNGSIVPNDKMGGTTIAPVYNIDARGATADLQKSLPGILAENNRRIFDELDRRYGIGR